jgi:peptidoglycan/xylan/chitin deacetylase (PgdA/CDA1 family)
VVSITFDDAYRSVLELAKPLLDRHGYPGTIFVPTDWPGDSRPMRWPGVDDWLGTPHEHELNALTWQELRELADAGWEVGSHTCSHPHLPELDDAVLARELCDSKAHIESELGQSCTSLAYPYGDVNAHVVDATRDAGYRWAATIPRVLSPPRHLTWPRAAIYHDDDMRRFATKVSPSLRRLRASHFGRSLDRVRIHVSERRHGGTSGFASGGP